MADASELIESEVVRQFMSFAPDGEGRRAWLLAARFCDSLRVEQNASQHTIRNYGVDLRDYLRWAQREKIDPIALSHRQLRRYLAELNAAQYSRRTVNRRLSALRGFFGWLVITGVIEASPADVLHGLKEDKVLPHRISAKEMVRILSIWGPVDLEGSPRQQSAVDLRNQAILEFLYACGARITEASELRLENVNFHEGYVRVFGKGSKERIIPIHDVALHSLQAYLNAGRERLLAGHAPNEFFFVSTRGNQMGTDAMRKMFKDTLAQAGVNGSYSPHDMRHTFASDLLDGGADLRSVQEMLGHVSLSTTQIYTHLTPGRMKSVHSKAHPRG